MIFSDRTPRKRIANNKTTATQPASWTPSIAASISSWESATSPVMPTEISAGKSIFRCASHAPRRVLQRLNSRIVRHVYRFLVAQRKMNREIHSKAELEALVTVDSVTTPFDYVPILIASINDLISARNSIGEGASALLTGAIALNSNCSRSCKTNNLSG